MSACCCSLAGTAACKTCTNNPNADLSKLTVATMIWSGSNFTEIFGNKPLTMADRIRAMSDDELAELLDDIAELAYSEGYSKETDEPYMSPYPPTESAWKDWLKQECDNGT